MKPTLAQCVKLGEITWCFFKIVDWADDKTLPVVTPLLAKLLQDFDSVCGFEPCTQFAAEIDVRAFYVIWKGSQSEPVKEARQKFPQIGGAAINMQCKYIQAAARKAAKGKWTQPNVLALMPMIRLGPECQTSEQIDEALARENAASAH